MGKKTNFSEVFQLSFIQLHSGNVSAFSTQTIMLQALSLYHHFIICVLAVSHLKFCEIRQVSKKWKRKNKFSLEKEKYCDSQENHKLLHWKIINNVFH